VSAVPASVVPMLLAGTYLEAISRESLRFHTVLTSCDPAARVPACPDWDAADLVWHLAEVQWFWTQVISMRPAAPPDSLERPARPSSYDELLGFSASATADLLSALTSAGPAATAWHWLPSGQTVFTSYRRQAHEALIHRLDAEQTASAVTELDAALATDGVLEALDWMYGGEQEGYTFTPSGGLVAVYAEDTDTTYWVEPGTIAGGTLDGPHLLVRPEPDAPAAAEVRGTAGDLDAWLWHRLPDDVVSLTGDRSALAAFRAAVSPPLD
jgi:uncharacterized protein (TIGR03083 family)